jgi:LysM repeat protein
MPLESLQYVIGVGSYRSVLKLHETLVRAYAEQLQIEIVQPDDNWWSLAQRLDMPLVQLRLFNPFLAARPLRPGYRIAYPTEPLQSLFYGGDENTTRYRARLGDNYIHLAFALGADLDALREANGLWRLEPLLPGTVMTIPLRSDGAFTSYRVAAGDNLSLIAERFGVDPWSIVRDNHLWEQEVNPAMSLRIPQQTVAPPTARAPSSVVHRVRSGENLSAISRRYGTSVRAIQEANSMGGRTRIQAGQMLKIPTD